MAKRIVAVQLSDEEIAGLDARAAKESNTRSGILRLAIRRLLGRADHVGARRYRKGRAMATRATGWPKRRL